jgi:hypothetical protein
MEGILKDIQVLIYKRLMGTATKTQVKEIEEAIEQMDEMPSSLRPRLEVLFKQIVMVVTILRTRFRGL